MIFLWISAVLLAFVAAVLIAPVEVMVDTAGPEAVIRWGTMRVWRIDLMGGRRSKGKEWSAAARGGKRVARRRKVRMDWQRMRRCIGALRVKEFYVWLDTGDFALNAQLYPLNFFSWPEGRGVSINFSNNCRLRMRISVRPWRLLAAWIK